jgi:tRNA-specific 2-thiouridylase
MRCNERIKFAALLEKALALGFDAVATGHYATILTDEHGNRELHRSAAWAKDQSYVLGVLTAEQLAHAMFPLGETPSKAEVRAEAAARGLTVAQKPDSHVTVGQRRGLDIGYPSDDGRPRFVLEVRPKTNEVVVGPREALAISELAGSRYTWAGMPPADPGIPFDCEVQVRAHGDPVAARARVEETELVVELHAPLDGVAPGQTAVIYVGTRVLGQCTIDRTVSAVPV